MDIQWFPGHMAKARREVSESLKLVDAVIEVLDARLPESSRNPMMREIIQRKPTVIVLAKADLADPDATNAIITSWTRAGSVQVVPVDCLRGTGLPKVAQAARTVTEAYFSRLAAKGIKRRTVRAMVVGIPNAGKSSLINRMAGRSVTKTGDKPGVTRQQQWIKVGQSFELLDTPGILWPKFEDPDVAKRLAWSGAIKHALLNGEELAQSLLEWLRDRYPERLRERYGITDLAMSADAMLRQVAIRRGALLPGGMPDLALAADHTLRDAQTGLLGRISFDVAPVPEVRI